MTSPQFIESYRAELGFRFHTFQRALGMLSQLRRPVHIIETGCARMRGSFVNEGRSSLIFAEFIKEVGGGSLESIDISPESMKGCREVTEAYKEFITYTVADSVSTLRNMSDEKIRRTDLFYLDSMDLRRIGKEKGFSIGGFLREMRRKRKARRSMRHHLEELKAIYSRLRPDALIMTDDNLGQVAKGLYVKDFLLERGWKLLNEEKDYQWIFRRNGV